MSSILIAGATGFIGSHALLAALDNPSVKSITVLSRRALPTGSDNLARLTTEQLASPKLTVIQHADFATYPDATVAALREAKLDAVVWALGRPRDGMDVHMGFTRACVTILQQLVREREEKSAFRFVYVSGSAVVRDQQASVWFLSNMRKQRGQVESFVVGLEEEKATGARESFVARPGMVARGRPIWSLVIPKTQVIPVRELGAALVDVAVNGSRERTLENLDLVDRGAKVIASST